MNNSHSALIVAVAIAAPYMKQQIATMKIKRAAMALGEGEDSAC